MIMNIVLVLVGVAFGFVGAHVWRENSFRREAEDSQKDAHRFSEKAQKLEKDNQVLTGCVNRLEAERDKLQTANVELQLIVDSDTANYQELLEQSERDLEQAKLEYDEILKENQVKINSVISENERLEGLMQRQDNEFMPVEPPKDYVDEELESVRDKAINLDAIRELATKKQWKRIADKHNNAVKNRKWQEREPDQRPTRVEYK